ncbi:MAG: hypothetical protein PSN34_08955 [Urechidicola sp.]|nr:hypothetical protein [Urechidicola sp.]
MNTQGFTYLLKHPSKINEEQTALLENVISAFPYLQSARVLYLKGLKNQDSFKYNQTLKTTAAYTTDRSILFNFITSPVFENTENTEVISEEVEAKSTTDTSMSETEELEIGKPLSFTSNESHSFGEWLQLGTVSPIKREESESKKATKFKIIDKFIASNPKIKPAKKEIANFTISEPVETDYSNLMTETLAKVYLEQKKYENAKKAYRILSLKYPEKSSFFANRIKAIEFLEKK